VRGAIVSVVLATCGPIVGGRHVDRHTIIAE
jgi:hypothetical protein